MAYGEGCSAFLLKHQPKEDWITLSYEDEDLGHQAVHMPYEVFDKLVRKHLGWCD
jgi:hypothetical protein